MPQGLKEHGREKGKRKEENKRKKKWEEKMGRKKGLIYSKDLSVPSSMDSINYAWTVIHLLPLLNKLPFPSTFAPTFPYTT